MGIVNSMLIAWLVNSLDPLIRSTVRYPTHVKDLWDDFRDRNSLGNGPRILELKSQIVECRQRGRSVAVYYAELRRLQDELASNLKLPTCTCSAAAEYVRLQERDDLVQFCMGLDSQPYGGCLSALLMMDPLPSLNVAYAKVIAEERKQLVSEGRSMPRTEAVGFSATGPSSAGLLGATPTAATSGRTSRNAAGGPPSVFVVLENYKKKQYSIRQLIPEKKNGHPAFHLEERVLFNVADEEQQVSWLFCPVASSTPDLYLLPDWCDEKPNHAYRFIFGTSTLKQISPPHFPKRNGSAVNLSGRLYFLEQSEQYLDERSTLECYDPATDSWETLKPLPNSPRNSRILATAVWGDDTILFNVATLSLSTEPNMHVARSRIMWAYDVIQKQWYPVDTEDDNWCCKIEGEAIVIGNTIYALTSLGSNSILVLSIEKKASVCGGPKFTCSVRLRIRIPDMEVYYSQYEPWIKTRRLFRLGNGDFCHIQSCLPGIPYQLMHITPLKFKGELLLESEGVHEFQIEPDCFLVLQAFSLPKDLTSALEKGKVLPLELARYSEVFVSTEKVNVDSLKDWYTKILLFLKEKHADSSPYFEAFVATKEDNTDSYPEPEVVKPVQEDVNMTTLAPPAQRG